MHYCLALLWKGRELVNRSVYSMCLILALASGVHAQISETPLAKLIESLKADDVDERREAAYELTRRRTEEPQAIEAMGRSLSDSDNQVRFQCLLGLAHAGEKAVPAIEYLIDRLADRDGQVRYRAGDALGKIGAAAIPKLAEAWKTKLSTSASIEAARAFAVIGSKATSALPLLVESLDSSTEELARCSAEAIVAIIPSDEAAMVDIAKRKTASVRAVGAAALGELENPSAKVYEQLKAGIADEDPLVREVAFIALAKSALPLQQKSAFVRQALVDSSPSMRAAALVVLRPAGLATPDFARKIADDLPDADGEQLNSLIRALGSIGAAAVDTLPELLVTAGSKPAVNRELLSQTLASVGRDRLPVLLEAIQTDPNLERVVAHTLALIGEPALETLLAGLASDSEIVRMVSIRGLGSMPNPSAEVIERLGLSLDDPQPSVRAAVVETLVSTPAPSEPVQQGLLRALRDKDPSVRAAAVLALPELAEHAGSECSEALDRGLDDAAEDVRANALLSLSRMDGFLEKRFDRLLALSQDKVAEVRVRAVGAMARLKGKLKEEATKEQLLNALVIALGDSDNQVRSEATQTVAALEFTDPRALVALSNNLTDDVDLLRASLATIVGFGHEAQELAPSVSQLIGHELSEIRVAAVRALVAIQADKPQLVHRLIAALDDADVAVRKIAALELGELGDQAEQAVPKLFSMLSNDEDSDFASGALREIDTAPVDAIPLLVASLGAEDRRTSFYSVSLLGKIGPPAREALPKLEELLKEKSSDRSSEFRRRFLVEAIAAIKGEELEKN